MTAPFQFDPTAALDAVKADTEKSGKEELTQLDHDTRLLSGKIINEVGQVVNGITADDDQPLEVQLASARQARAKLQSMLDAITNGSPTASTLTPEQQELLQLQAEGHVKIIPMDDPANPGQKIRIVRDFRRPRKKVTPEVKAPEPATTPSEEPTRPEDDREEPTPPETPAAAAPVTTTPASPPSSTPAPATPPAQAATSTPAPPPPATTSLATTAGTPAVTAPIPAPAPSTSTHSEPAPSRDENQPDTVPGWVRHPLKAAGHYIRTHS